MHGSKSSRYKSTYVKKVKKIPMLKMINDTKHLARLLKKKFLGANLSVPFRTNCNFMYN